ncbi:hypothetical protein H0H87_003625 [Tephrocybe sp. NHM501043]|nr:hypothetical protein H0H87_003625 [Tephrocybe sp. NHM501043]
MSVMLTTLQHWHGFFQAGTPWADGPVGATQCPIIPGQSFLYDFKTPGQAGTFWYHIPAPSAGPVPTSDATLINGKGRYPSGPTTPLAVVSVIQGLRYRFRLVSISCDPNYVFSIDGHTMTIIEVDGINVQPLEVDSIQIFAGQRYSFVLKANQRIDNYWIRAKPNFSRSTTFDGGLNSAILRYLLAPHRDPTTTQTPNSNPMLETSLRPLKNPAAPGVPTVGAADVNINLAIALDFVKFQFTVNGATFIPPTAPVLLQLLSGAKTAQELLPPGSVYLLPPNKVIEVSIPGGTIGAPHPFHLHGHAFSVVRSAGSDVYNFANPVQRDVVSTGGLASDNVTIRFKTDNPGPWIFHCHIDWHLELGLAIVFAEDVPSVANMNPPSELYTISQLD